ncbi:MAG: hypothetical protein M1818_006984 [Claussenomyces sp. TS43310]|nr:MAG: hypothetical protein M1818_006984 [Claussenomyces sp. TS43310]
MSGNVVPNFPNRGPLAFIVTTTTLAIASIFVLARLISRLAILRHVTCDDFFILAGWLVAVGLSCLIDYGTRNGLGRYDVNILDGWMPALRRCEYAFAVMYNPALMLTKTSILVFYLRLARTTTPFLRIASYLTLAVVNIAGIVLTFLTIFQCNPVGAVFASEGRHAKCIPLLTLYLASAPVNIITDLAVLVLPIPVLTGMQLPRKQKNILVVTFALGVFVVAVDVVRVYFLQQAFITTAPGSLSASYGPISQIGGQPNFSWYASLSLMWSAVEVNVGIICACIPTLKPLFIRVLPNFIDYQATSHDKHGSDAVPTGSGFDGEPQQQLASTFEITNPDATWRPASVAIERDQAMDMMTFLTTPGSISSAVRPSSTQRRPTTNSVYFGFINMRRPKSMLLARGRESFRYCTLVTVLFFVWGFSYGILNSLNSAIVAVSHGRSDKIFGLQTAYFGAYFFGPLLVGRRILEKGGFKVTFIVGLCIYGIGTLMFWPSAVLTSYPGFIVSNFVVGSGLSLLETAANPFLVLCGASEYAEVRLLVAQGVQGVASVVSPLLANKVLFRNLTSSSSLIDIQWTYVAIAFFDVILALFFYYLPLPEATDEALEMQILQNVSFPSASWAGPPTSQTRGKNIESRQIVNITLAFGVASLFLYVGAQESLSLFFEGVLDSISPQMGHLSISSFGYQLVARTTFAIGRFFFAGLCMIVKPRHLLLASYVGTLIFAVTAFAIKSSSNTTAGLLITCFLFEGPLFPLIFAISLRRMGRRTKLAAVLLVAATSGGGALPWIMYAVYFVDAKTIRYSLCVVVALFATGTLFPIYLNVCRHAKGQVDPQKSKSRDDHRPEERLSGEQKSIRGWSLKFSAFTSRFRSSQTSAGLPTVEHEEKRRADSADGGV